MMSRGSMDQLMQGGKMPYGGKPYHKGEKRAIVKKGTMKRTKRRNIKLPTKSGYHTKVAV